MTIATAPRSPPASSMPSPTDAAAAPAGRAKLRRKRRKHIGVATAALVAVTAAVVAMRPAAVVVDIGVVDRGVLTSTLDEPGRTKMERRAVVSAPSAGNVLPTRLEPGDFVEAGAMVALLEPVPAPLLDAAARSELAAAAQAGGAAEAQARVAVARMQAALDSARRNLARQERLQAGGAVARTAVEDVRDAVRALEHDLEGARFAALVAAEEHAAKLASLRRASGRGGGAPLTLKSPFDGVVLAVPREHGGIVVAGEPLVEIGEQRSVVVVVPVLTDDAVDVKPGARVMVGVGSLPQASEVRGRVRRVEPKAETKVSALGVEEQRVNVIVDLDEPPPAVLGDGFTAHARIVRWEGEVVRVPAGALFRRGEGWAVWLDDDGKAAARDVVVGHRAGAWAEVIRGLAPGDRVVLFPGDSVRSRTPLRERSSAEDPVPG